MKAQVNVSTRPFRSDDAAKHGSFLAAACVSTIRQWITFSNGRRKKNDTAKSRLRNTSSIGLLPNHFCFFSLLSFMVSLENSAWLTKPEQQKNWTEFYKENTFPRSIHIFFFLHSASGVFFLPLKKYMELFEHALFFLGPTQFPVRIQCRTIDL